MKLDNENLKLRILFLFYFDWFVETRCVLTFPPLNLIYRRCIFSSMDSKPISAGLQTIFHEYIEIIKLIPVFVSPERPTFYIYFFPYSWASLLWTLSSYHACFIKVYICDVIRPDIKYLYTGCLQVFLDVGFFYLNLTTDYYVLF